MTPEDFRQIVLNLPEASESGHMGHPDFRVRGKIFATLGYPDDAWAMVKLSAEQQHEFIKTNPTMFSPVKGGWGRRGSTLVSLKQARKAVVKQAVALAWRNATPKNRQG